MHAFVFGFIIVHPSIPHTHTNTQVAEWVGRREAWSAPKSTDSRTKPTQWEFSGRERLRHDQHEQHAGDDDALGNNDDDDDDADADNKPTDRSHSNANIVTVDNDYDTKHNVRGKRTTAVVQQEKRYTRRRIVRCRV